MERLGRWLRVGKRRLAGLMAVILVISSIGIPVPAMGSEIWPQKSTAPYYCLDGGKGWKASDRYEIYLYNTLPSPLSEIQAKRLFWAYPTNWNALKEAASKYDIELYQQIAATVSNPNIVKRVKDDAGTKFAWVADHTEIEERAISALEQVAKENSVIGKEVPEPIRAATSEETAASFFVPAFSAGPGALDTEFKLSKEFIRDIAKIEAQSVWDNGSTGGNVGWLDASQDKNIAKAVLGNELYEITWSGDSIKIHNNGSAVANENVAGGKLTEEQIYNKTTVRYKITMREGSGWYTDGSWNRNYLTEWMDFKACVNAPGHQRLYKADIRIVPSDMVFYLVISQGPSGDSEPRPEYGGESADVEFQVYRHEEKFESHYNVKLQKLDDETGKPLKGSQFYLYERFEDAEKLSENEFSGRLREGNLSFSPWQGFQIFAEGITDENGEITHTDTRNYVYSKTYCDGHGMPEWAEVPEVEENIDGENDADEIHGAEEARDQNRKAAEQWLDVFESCEEAEEELEGTHFHWAIDEEYYDVIKKVAEDGNAEIAEGEFGATAEKAFESSGCKDDCERTYQEFINLRFTYTWKEIQARHGYILHDVHPEDVPIHFVTTVSSEADAKAYVTEGNSTMIKENIWYVGNNEKARAVRNNGEVVDPKDNRKDGCDGLLENVSDSNSEYKKYDRVSISVFRDIRSEETIKIATRSNAVSSDSNVTTSSNSKRTESVSESQSSKPTLWDRILNFFSVKSTEEADYDSWSEKKNVDEFRYYLEEAEKDRINHLKKGEDKRLSYADKTNSDHKFWMVRDHRTEGEIHINKRDMDLYKEESEEYSAYSDTEGDGVLEGASYGLFAAEDIVHPDADLSADGTMTNTGIVYKKNDLVAVATTDVNGDADFYTYTVMPGMTFDYEMQQIIKRGDLNWTGPDNRYFEDEKNGWIGRPLILGNYYVKELIRSEGYELSINGKSQEWTNYGSNLETPDNLLLSKGTAIVTLPELTATMEGEDATGNGFDQLSFAVTSSGTTDENDGVRGYDLVVSGFPENTEFYRVDSGEMEVTGPHVTGTEKVVVKDAFGNIVWKKADSDTSHIRYVPEFDEEGNVIGQLPMSQNEPQIQTFEQIPQAKNMTLQRVEINTEEPLWNQSVLNSEIADKGSEIFTFLKAELESILNQNGYDVPVTAAGIRSKENSPVFSMGVLAGQPDLHGMTTEVGKIAVKTVYGAAVQEVHIEDINETTKISQLFGTLLTWYQENSQWNFGGLHEIRVEDDEVVVTLYAGVSNLASRCFFTTEEQNGQSEPKKVYTVLENPKTLRWEYQEYLEAGDFQYRIDDQYFLGNEMNKRYYMDVTLAPVVMIDRNGTRTSIDHQVMVYHSEGEEIIDYIKGDPEYGYRVPLTELVDKIEITTEKEFVEQDVRLSQVRYDKETKTHTIFVETTGNDVYGNEFSDAEQSLKLTFMAKLPKAKAVLSETDLHYIGNANVYGYQERMEIGYAEYLMRFTNAAIQVSLGKNTLATDTYICTQSLIYRGQEQIVESGNTIQVPIQVLERPIKQKIKVKKEVLNEEPIGNFRFKIYLKSNLERLYCNRDGKIDWTNKYGETVDVMEYKRIFPELVQNFYTKNTENPLLEYLRKTIIAPDGTKTQIDTYNYEKFFDAIKVANKDKWKNDGFIWNTSWKPIAQGLFTGIENEINTSVEAKENAKRSDAVRQFAIDWYLDDEVETLTVQGDYEEYRYASDGDIQYADEIYDKALYQAIIKAEEYLKPFFLYDLDFIYGIPWDSENRGGIDQDTLTLAADQVSTKENLAYGISEYLPYGDYVIVEQQPYNAEWNDLVNRHYEIDAPKELSLPQHYDEMGNLEDASTVPWSITEPGTKDEMAGYAEQSVRNKRYFTKLRIEKLDAETGEPILHDGAIFALYQAERNEGLSGDGSVKRYNADTVISGSKPFLEAMGAKNVTSFARIDQKKSLGIGIMYTGMVSKGTPICHEENVVIFYDDQGNQKGSFSSISTEADLENPEIMQVVGYVETPDPIEVGVYVLAELKAPAGYVRSKPIPIEVYSDQVRYYLNGEEKVNASIFNNMPEDNNTRTENEAESARIFVNDIATSLEVSKIKTSDSYRGMKVSGRVEGTLVELEQRYGLENLDLAYNNNGKFLNFAWKKGTLEYLENRKAAGERVQLVYESGVFQGYGYVTRTLETADDENKYVPGAQLILYQAIAVKKNGNSEDFAFSNVHVERDKYGTVKRITVRDGEETPVLFYDLSNLEVLQKSSEGKLYGFDRNGQRMKITFDTKSIYAIQNGKVAFEINGGFFDELVYSTKDKAFTKINANTKIYHLDENLRRDAQVDGYTGLAYIEKTEMSHLGEESRYYVWPVTEIKNEKGDVIIREKQLSGRPGEKNSGTAQAYTTGTVQGESGVFEKKLNPVMNESGLNEYYPSNSFEYKKGQEVLDRDGERIDFHYDDLLEKYGLAGYRITEDPEIYGEEPLLHRQGESWMIPNIWISGAENPNDPQNQEMTEGRADLLRRVEPGSYIMEELNVPDGYVKSLPVAIQVNESTDVQKVSMVNEKTKVEIAKVEGAGNYIGKLIENVELVLYKAKRVYSMDYEKYPKGYFLVKDEMVESWITGDTPKYFEGLPVGDYVLEESRTPKGYIPNSMEITIQEQDELQSFIFTNEHTNVEVFKYEVIDETRKQPLRWPAEAELTLYPAVLDSMGEVVLTDGEYLYENDPVTSWKTGSCEQYEIIVNAYEDMYRQYGAEFDRFSWSFVMDGITTEGTAVLEGCNSTTNKEVIIQYWRLNDSSILRITSSGTAAEIAEKEISKKFSYQFQYKEGGNESYPNLISYETQNGLHRFNYIPVGTYVLVETQTPKGYITANPIIVRVEETKELQTIYLENERLESVDKKGKLVIHKIDANQQGTNLEGACFEVKNLQDNTSYRIITGKDGYAVLENLPIKGRYESGVEGPCVYEVKEILSPEGYCLNYDVYRFRFNEDMENAEILYEMVVENNPTEIEFSKTDFATGHFIIGASLAVYQAKIEKGEFVAVGEPIERWISGPESHKIVGKLSGGKTYLLVEESAPTGYMLADPIRFTISGDGKHIISITENMSTVQIQLEEDTDNIKSICMIGRVATEIKTQRNDRDGISVLEEWLLFLDGSLVLLEQETFRQESGSKISHGKGERYPIGTEYSLFDSEGVRIDRWSVSVDTLSHEVLNERNQDGCLLFELGENYYLEEEVLFSDGTRITTSRMVIQQGNSSTNTKLEILNRETDVRIRKTDLVTGKELPGAELRIKSTDGEVIDSWISGKEEHIIRGKLLPGKTYILSEKMSAEGYAYAEEISFTVHESGLINRVVMEDRPTNVQIRKVDMMTGEELPGAKLILKDENGVIVDQWISEKQPHWIKGQLIAGAEYTLIEEIAPKGYLLAEEVRFTVSRDGKIDRIVMKDQREDKDEVPEDVDESADKPKETPKLIQEESKIGYLIAQYEPTLKQIGTYRLNQPSDLNPVSAPRTGEDSSWIYSMAGILFSLIGLCVIDRKRKNHYEKAEKHE